MWDYDWSPLQTQRSTQMRLLLKCREYWKLYPSWGIKRIGQGNKYIIIYSFCLPWIDVNVCGQPINLNGLFGVCLIYLLSLKSGAIPPLQSLVECTTTFTEPTCGSWLGSKSKGLISRCQVSLVRLAPFKTDEHHKETFVHLSGAPNNFLLVHSTFFLLAWTKLTVLLPA